MSIPNMPPVIEFSDQLRVLNLIAYVRKLRVDLDDLAISPSRRRINRISDQQQTAIFDLLKTIDQLFPGGPMLSPPRPHA